MITIEQIDEFRKRTNSSYEDAKFYLEKNNGDVLDAIIDFERTKTGGKSHNAHYKKNQEDYGKRFADILQKGFDTRICIEDKNAVLFTIPVILMLLLIPLWPMALLFFVFLMVLGYKFSIRDVKNENVNVSSFFSNINEKMKDTGNNKDRKQDSQAGQVNNNMPQKTDTNSTQVSVPNNIDVPGTMPQQEKPKEEDYKEYTIE